jgi:D-amino-acid dehydrogenase
VLLDRQDGPGRQTSFANGGLLTPSMADPWNAPGCWRVLLRSLGRSDSPLQLRLKTLPMYAKWGIGFLRQSRVEAYERNALSNLRLAMHSLRVLDELTQETKVEYGRSACGTLRLFRDEVSLAVAATRAERTSVEGLKYRRLSMWDTVKLEPELASVADEFKGAIHYLGDEIGDAYRFCLGLAAHAQTQGVEFRFETEISGLEIESRRLRALVAGRERVVADQYVFAAGSWTSPLLRRSGMRIPVKPVKGYSVTFDQYGTPPLTMPVIDDGLHAALVPLERAVRVAGTAEFAGFDCTLRPERVRNLVNLAYQVLPRARLDTSSAKPWCGLRPMSVDGVPIIGATPIDNLFINTGHGHLGWTMAAGSGSLLAELMVGRRPRIDPTPYRLERFAT